MRILVVDSNLIFAKKVGRFLQKHVRDARIKFATNVPILQRRLRDQDYDFIIADILSAFDSDAMAAELKSVDIPVLIWSVLGTQQDLYKTFKTNMRTRIITKPKTEKEMMETVSSMSALSPAVAEIK